MSIRGTWIPSIVGLQPAAGTAGIYQRTGDMVTVFADIRWGAITGIPSQLLTIEGFPFDMALDANGNGRMFVSQFMAWSNVELSGLGLGGNAVNPPTTDQYYPEVFTRSIVRSGSRAAQFAVYVGANDLGFPNLLYTPAIENVLANGEVSFTWSYMTDEVFPT